MEQEYHLFKYKMLSRTEMEIYERCIEIYFYECLHEYFLYQENIDWEGADVHAIQEDGTVSPRGYTCSTMEAVMKRKDILLQSYPQVVIRDSATRKEKIYSKTRMQDIIIAEKDYYDSNEETKNKHIGRAKLPTRQRISTVFYRKIKHMVEE